MLGMPFHWRAHSACLDTSSPDGAESGSPCSHFLQTEAGVYRLADHPSLPRPLPGMQRSHPSHHDESPHVARRNQIEPPVSTNIAASPTEAVTIDPNPRMPPTTTRIVPTPGTPETARYSIERTISPAKEDRTHERKRKIEQPEHQGRNCPSKPGSQAPMP